MFVQIPVQFFFKCCTEMASLIENISKFIREVTKYLACLGSARTASRDENVRQLDTAYAQIEASELENSPKC